METSISKALLSVPELMAACGLGRTKVYELIGSGEIETVTVGRRRMVPAKSLDAWIESLRGAAA